MQTTADKDRAKNPIWLIVLALLGVMYTRTSTPPPPPTEPSGTRAKQAEITRKSIPTREPELNDVAIEVHNLIEKGGFRPHVLIAFMPDPEPGATQVGWLFDSHVEALQRAAQRAGYLLFRRALPRSWTEPRESSARAAPTASDRSLPAQEPGLLVFRSQKKTLLLVFLVGESPARGAELEEFSRVFNWLWYLDRSWPSKQPREELPILGPTFSGSAWSIARAISTLKPKPGLEFRMVSGTATGPDVKKTLEKDGLARFNTTVIPDKAVMGTLYEYLKAHRVPLSKVALLVESTTEYGKAVFEKDAPRRKNSPRIEDASRGKDAPRIEDAPRIAFQFPLQVAQARVAHEQGRPARSQPAPGSFESRINQIELSLDDPITPVDVVPPLNPRMTSASVDLVLANMLGTMAREDVRYVAIVATDTRDKLFLARKLREYLPDVRILTTESSLLYTHPAYLPYLDGTIVASTYPLFSKSQLWTPDGATARVVQFADAGSEGVYNATLALLGKRRHMKDYDTPRFGRSNGEPRAYRPPIWITAVGHGGMWPLAVTPAYHAPQVLRGVSSGSGRAKDLVGRVSYSRTGLGLLLAIGLFATAHALIVLRHWPAPKKMLAWQKLEPLRPLKGKRNRQRVWLLGLLMMLATWELALLALLVVFIGCSWNDTSVVAGAGVVAVAASIAVVVPLALLMWAVIRVGRPVAGPVLALAIVSAAALSTWEIFTSGPSADWVFLYLRATNPGSGLSFVLPMMLVGTALYLWCFHHLRRLYFSEVLTLENPLAGGGVPYGGALEETEAAIEGIQHGTVFAAVPWYITLPAFTVAALPCAALWQRMLPGFDGVWSDRVFFAAFALAYFAVLSACLRFVWLWLSVRRLLHQLEHHPLTGAFGHLPTSMSLRLRQRLYRYVPGPADRLRSARLWLRLGGCFTPRSELFVTPAPLLPEADVRALSATHLGAVFEAESLEQRAAGRELAGAESASQRALTLRAAEIARVVMPRSPGFELARREAPEVVRKLLAGAEKFVAIQVLASLGPKFVQLGNLIEFAVIGMLLITFAFAVYPFQPQQLLALFNLTLAGGVVLVLLIAIVQADRDPLLSRIGATEPGHLSLDRRFWGQIARYGAVPIGTVLATQFPAAGPTFDWVFRLIN